VQLLLLEHRQHLLRFGKAAGVDEKIGKVNVDWALVGQKALLQIPVQARHPRPQPLNRVHRLLAPENR
jgi:hypothetical protein